MADFDQGSRVLPSRIDTSFSRETYDNNVEVSEDPYNPYITTTQLAGLPAFQLSSSLSADFGPASTIQPQASNADSNFRARNESRKLLSHVLNQLLTRVKPPSISEVVKEAGCDVTGSTIGAFMSTLRDVTNLRKVGQSTRLEDGLYQDDSDDEKERRFSTDDTFDLMLQLKDVLIMTMSQGWHIFNDQTKWHRKVDQRDDKSPSPFRRSRSSFQSGRKPSRSPSPGSNKIQVPELLSSCISILSSVISEDCRFKINLPRPSRPPNALQALTLNIAQFLIHTQQYDPATIARIGFAVIPAFSTFQEEMYSRLLSFFEDVVIRGILESLRNSQGFADAKNVVSPTQKRLETTPIVSIQIDEVHGDTPPQRPELKIRSANAPHQASVIYYLSSIIAPLLAAILESLDIQSLEEDHEHSRRFYRLLNLIVTLKFDAYNDLLQIVAYHGSKPRKQACALLSLLWPKVIGHATISRPLYKSNSIHRIGLLDTTQRYQGSVNAHQFVPWKFIHRSGRSEARLSSVDTCSFCSTTIDGFGLLCPYCMCSVHFDCYEPTGGNFVLQYSLDADTNVQRVAVYRFSFILPDGRDDQTSISIEHHGLRRINLFTLSLCHVCHEPLWGCVAQALKCADCLLIVHKSCALPDSLPRCGHVTVKSQDMTIDLKALRRSAVNYYPESRWSHEQLSIRSYEEILIFRDTLETQLRLLTNGVALGSIVVMQGGKNAAHAKGHQVEEFELHRLLKWCKELLASHKLQPSSATKDYMEENKLNHIEHSILYDFSKLVYLSTAMKSPILLNQSNSHPSSELLNVNQPDMLHEHQADSVAHPYELIPLSHLREVLQVEFNIHTPEAAKVILNHLHHLALFDRKDCNADPFHDIVVEGDESCIFALPLGLDLSTDVETLVSAIEVCLLDLDPSVNEFAFLMVVRKFWPNGLMSDYGLRRLARSILSWIVTEDDSLATILRDYIAKQKTLPGVRAPDDIPPWPFAHASRSTADTQSSNGRDYITVRHTLLSRFAVPWLLALHNQDTEFYERLVYDTCIELADDRVGGVEVFDVQVKSKDNLFRQSDALLFSIIKLLQSSVLFTCFESLVLRWLRSMNEAECFDRPLTSLNRLFPRENESSVGLGGLVDPEVSRSVGPQSPLKAMDPLRAILNAGRPSSEDLTRSLKWLLMFARSGVDIPLQIFFEFLELTVVKHLELSQAHLLIQTAVSSLWLKSMGRQNVQQLFATFHTKFCLSIVAAVTSGIDSQGEIGSAIIRQSLIGCLLLYGCDRGSIVNAGMIKENEIRDLPSRRKLGSRGSALADPVHIDPVILQAISHYLDTGVIHVSCCIAQFFSIFFTSSPFIEAYEIDNFILRNGGLLASCAWQFYEIQKDNISAIRTRILLRILVVDSEPFRDLVHDLLVTSNPWELRLLAVNRLSRILTDVTSPVFDVDGRQWRSSIADVFICYFSVLWLDPQEEIRLSVRVFLSTLLPAQLEAISQCWNEFLAKSPMVDRIRMISFLIQLRPQFPGWRVVSWDTLIETFVEFNYNTPKNGVEISPISAYFTHRSSYASETDSDMTNLLASILILGLQMIADGVQIDTLSLLKIKAQLVRVIGFEDVSAIPLQNSSAFLIQYGEVAEIPESAYPCIQELVSVVDASHCIELPASVVSNFHDQDEKNVTALVGYVFIDVVLHLIANVEDMESLPALILKYLLEAIYIILHKYDFEIQPARGLQPLLRQALGRIVELLSKNISYESRQLSLTVIQAFTKRSQGLMGPIIFTIFEHVADVIVSQSHHAQDSLPLQGKTLLSSILNSHYNNGLFLNILKRPLKLSVFVVLKQVVDMQGTGNQGLSESLCDLILRDTLSRASDCEPSSFQTVINNLLSYVQVVHHDSYSYDLITYTGQQLALLMRRMSDSMFDGADPSPLLLIFSILMQNNKRYSRELLPYIDTTLRVALTRSSLEATCLVRLAIVTQSQIRESSTLPGKTAATLLELLSDGLRLKARVLPMTIKSLVECLLGHETPVYAEDSEARFNLVSNLMENACYFLDNHLWLGSHSEIDFSASVAVAEIILQALSQNPFAADSCETESSQRILGSLRSWIILGLTSLHDPRKGWVVPLFKQFSAFARIYAAIMRSYVYSGFGGMESATGDINHAYVAMKLWLMIAYKVSSLAEEGDGPMLKVWNELWPLFESMVNVLEVEAKAGLSPTLIILASTSVADLLLFLRSLRSPIALDISNHLDILTRLRTAPGDTSNSKVSRAFRGIYEAPPEITFEVLLEQTSKELIATEKLRVIDTRREAGRVGAERHRRDMRLAT